MLGLAACRQVGACASVPSCTAAHAPHKQPWVSSSAAPQWQQQRRSSSSGSSSGGGGGSSAGALPQQRHRAAFGAGSTGAGSARRQWALALVPCAALKAGGTREKLPIFPLSMVALPAADVPLQIFEARYRVLFATLLAGAQG